MSNSFADMKRNRGQALEKLNQEAAKLKNSSRKEDERFWKPTIGKDGNGYAVIRFLPAPQGEDVAWVRIFHHGFQGPGGWYIENSLTTIGQSDPVGEMNSKLWNSTKDDESPARKQARNQKRKLNYISNIQVIKDPANPENEGKVFLYKYGAKIFDKLNAKMNPPAEYVDVEAINPFDLWNGCNFRIKIRSIKGADGKTYPNYDNSEFDSPSAVATNDEDIEKIWKQEYSLQQFIAPDQFKTREELLQRLNTVLQLNTTKKNEENLERDMMPDVDIEGNTNRVPDEDENYFSQFADD